MHAARHGAPITGTVPTFSGTVPAPRLGQTLIHEHLFVNVEEPRGPWEHAEWDEDTAIDTAVRELEALAALGVSALMDLTVPGLGRDAGRVARVAARSPVLLMAATGWYSTRPLPSHALEEARERPACDDDPLIDLMIGDLTLGIQGTDVKAAAIKVASDSPDPAPETRHAFVAAVEASRRTGAPILTHSDPATGSSLAQLDLLVRRGVPAARIVVGHCGDTTDVALLAEIASRGAFLGLDRFGMEQVLDDEARVRTLLALLERGLASQIVLSQDAAVFSTATPPSWRAARSPRWRLDSLHRRIIPELERAGVGQDELDQMMVRNPATLLGRA
ncbi:phosphotriesterase family protein [Demequina zhanjiangensis]|uniref:Phosphotriesterase-related protein n=1 Tax=Demequina zhanjiangensis TaxID=3051659 RepID=A0ABT8G4I8_9MICO|nr:hypothetical protein [Demequina sp. SYSU T00b26]MDN4473629.1 hypothetical protein [Demequina sp. SYSU T00b26]